MVTVPMQRGAVSRGDERRLPPGQEITRDRPVLDLGRQPLIAPSDWSLRIGGLVACPMVWRWSDLLAQPATESTSDIHCVTGWSRFDNRWRGISALRVWQAARPHATARFVIVRSFDGYATSLAVDDWLQEGVLLATHWDGEKLPRSHGGPVRLVVPHLYFWKSAKWLRQLWFTDREAPGYWESRGYHRRGDPWRQQRRG